MRYAYNGVMARFMEQGEKRKKRHLQECKWHFDTQMTLRTFVGDPDTLCPYYIITAVASQCCFKRKSLSDREKRDIIYLYSIRNPLPVVQVPVFHSIQMPVGVWVLFCIQNNRIPLPGWQQSARAAMFVRFFI